MRTPKSGILGLALVTAILAACEQKAPIVNLPPDTTTTPATVEIVPGSLTLPLTTPRTTRQLTAVVSGITNQAVTWDSDNDNVATVSTSGLVTAVGVGNATISAVSTGDPRGRDAIEVTVTDDDGGEGGPSTVTIQSVTQGGTVFPVQINNVQGQIDITANVDIPVGSSGTLEFLVDNVIVCQQEFTNGTGAEGVNASQVPVPVVCSVNTGQYDSTAVSTPGPNGEINVVNLAAGDSITISGAVPTFLNGPHTVSARILNDAGDPTAETVRQTYVFNNQNFINAKLDYSNGCALSGQDATRPTGVVPANVAPFGSLWCAGDLMVSMRPVIYTRTAGVVNDSVSSATVSLTTGGTGSNGTTSCDGIGDGGSLTAMMNTTPMCGSVTAVLTDTRTDGILRVTYDYDNRPTATTPGVSRIEDNITLMINSITAGGQVGPTCINPDPALNPWNVGAAIGGRFNACGTGVAGGSAANVVFTRDPQRLDNLAPRILLFALPGYNYLGTDGFDEGRARYLNADFTFAGSEVPDDELAVRGTGAPRWDIDYGVDRQNASINSCPTTANQATGGCIVFHIVTPAGVDSAVTSGADVARLTQQTQTNNILGLHAEIRDALNNTATWYPTGTLTPTMNPAAAVNVGLDLVDPFVTFNSVTCQQFYFAIGGTPTRVQDGNCTYPDGAVVPNDQRDAVHFEASPPVANVDYTTLPPSDAWVFMPRDTAPSFLTPPAGPSGFFLNRTLVNMNRYARTTTPSNIIGGSANGYEFDADGRVLVTDSSLASDGRALQGYFKTRTYAIDAAGNQSGVDSMVVLEDFTAPTMGGITAPSTIRGGENITYTADTDDNVERGDVAVYISFGCPVGGSASCNSGGPGGMSGYDLVHRPAGAAGTAVGNVNNSRLILGTYGPDAFTAPGATTIEVTRQLAWIELTNASGRATGVAGRYRAQEVSYITRDVAGMTLGDPCPTTADPDADFTVNCLKRTLNIAANVLQGLNGDATPQTFAGLNPVFATTAADSQGVFRMSNNTEPYSGAPANVSVCNNASTCSTLVTAVVTGPQASFAQPFDEVRFYYRDDRGREFLIGNATLIRAVDDDVNNIRRWAFQATWNTFRLVGGAYEVFAVGVIGGGGLVTMDGQTVTVGAAPADSSRSN
jgi:hypothetical protein